MSDDHFVALVPIDPQRAIIGLPMVSRPATAEVLAEESR